MGEDELKILAPDSPHEYFRKLVQGAIKNQKVDTSEEAEFYLVHLLGDFIDAGRLFCTDVHGSKEEPLALMLARALQANYHRKIQILKHMGDIALYIAGFFPESIHRKLINIEYYIQMGGSAYQTISDLISPKVITKLFGELAQKFVPLVDVLSEVSEKSMLKGNPNILQLYELWLSTGSERVQQILLDEGITPHNLPGLKNVQ